MTQPVLTVRGLRTVIATQGRPVKPVDGVDLDIFPAETLALVGESGSGKTMLALSIARLLPPPARIVSGDVRFGHRELTRMTEEELRGVRGRGIGFVFQDPMSSLNPVMTAGSQIAETVLLHRGVSRPEADRIALDLLAQVQIPDPADRARQYPHQLSGGMRQRVMIAIALAGNPSLLIADEPTTALDVTTQAEILALLAEIKRAAGMAVLLITHDLGAVAPHADRVAVMYAGKIVELAPAARLYRSPSHPYTQALLACLPKVGAGKQALRTIGGSVPDLRFVPPGCSFHGRCDEAEPRCGRDEPELREIAPGHWVRCWARETP